MSGMDAVKGRGAIELENGDIYSHHNAVETILIQWGLPLVAVGLAWMTTGLSGADFTRVIGWSSIGLMVATSAVTTVLAVYSWRRRIYMEITDWWDGIAALVLTAGLIGLATATGGYQSPVWFVPFAAAAYIAAVFVYQRGYLALASLLAMVVAAGVVADGMTQSDLAYGLAIALSMSVTFMLVKELGRVMYDLIWETGEHRISLIQTVSGLREVLSRTAKGDFTQLAEDSAEDETALELQESVNETVLSLRSLVEQVRLSGRQLTEAAASMVGVAQQQVAGAAQQNGTVSETTATIEELAATAAQIAETAGSVARVAAETLALTDEGRGAVAESVEAMDQIRSVVDQIGVSSAGLGDKITQVGQILSLIDELSEQTNLLALNAAIEAARAGEHGRGFAVVAAEVRKLAERAQESTSQIQGIVTEIQAHTRSTVLASEEGARAAERGSGKAAGAVVALDRIAAMVDEATGAAEEISIATQQQRSASDQVVVAMTQVSEVSRQTSSGAEAGVTAAAQLDVLATELGESIAAFRTEEP